MLASCLPARAGVGFKPEHFAEIAALPRQVAFLEIHAENYMGAGGPPHARLSRLRADHALSIHGVGLSIGAPQGLDRAHLARLARLCDRYQPESFSEHLAWSSHGADYLADLLPLPYTEETLAIVARHVDEVQEALGRQMLLENPATYVTFAESCIAESEFLAEVVRRTGCGLLLDVNNVFVSAVNHGSDAAADLADFPLAHVREVHLSGHFSTHDDAGLPLLIDAHDSPVTGDVWQLYDEVLNRIGPVATLIEWDNDVPAWPRLRAEAEAADFRIARAARRNAA